jgi:hypothetical protein
MILLAMVIFTVSPFYDANFLLAVRSVSVFSNPSGLGVSPGAEAFATYHPEPELITTGANAGNFGFGFLKMDTVQIYEVAIGYRLPGAFTVGYAYEFGDTSVHIIGVECRPNQQLSLGYKIGLGSKKPMSGGIRIMPYLDYVTLSFAIEYEGIEDTLMFHYGAMVTPLRGLSAFFIADKEFNWNVGMEISLGYAKLAGIYTYQDSKFSAGILISAQRYETFMQ